MHRAREPEKHFPNQLVEDVARRASLTDPPLEEAGLFRSHVCFKVQRQRFRKKDLANRLAENGFQDQTPLSMEQVCADPTSVFVGGGWVLIPGAETQESNAKN